MKSIDQVPIGSLVHETIEKYDATVVGIQIHISGCNRVCLQEKRFKDGKAVKVDSADVQTVEMKKKEKNGRVVDPGAASDVMGLRARSKTTGVEGTITVVQFDPKVRHFHITPSKREKNGDRMESFWVEEAFVQMIDKPKPLVFKSTGNGFVNCGAR
jgi:hypothetical protein